MKSKFAQRVPETHGDCPSVRTLCAASVDNNKPWIEYTNGKITNKYNGTLLPGTKSFDKASYWQKTYQVNH